MTVEIIAPKNGIGGSGVHLHEDAYLSATARRY